MKIQELTRLRFLKKKKTKIKLELKRLKKQLEKETRKSLDISEAKREFETGIASYGIRIQRAEEVQKAIDIECIRRNINQRKTSKRIERLEAILEQI